MVLVDLHCNGVAVVSKRRERNNTTNDEVVSNAKDSILL
jgi:hypothetical protein